VRTDRLEAFSDGVIAIIITIFVLELPKPDAGTLHGLHKVWPVLLSYVLSFIIIGIYWNNHHHMLRATQRISGMVLWANLFLLFWLSLFPFATGWMGENHFARVPTAVYGFVLLMAAIAWCAKASGMASAYNPSETRLLRSLPSACASRECTPSCAMMRRARIVNAIAHMNSTAP